MILVTRPKPAVSNFYRTNSLRGGSWFGWDRYDRSAFRFRYLPDDASIAAGFRVLRKSLTQGKPTMVFTDTDSILHALTIDPNDTTGWFALTDALIEEGREQSARLLRMTLNQLDPDSYDPEVEKQIQAMLLEKVPVVMPRIVNSIGMEFKVTPPGINVMGSPDSEPHRHSDEGPQHLVQMEGLYMGTFPVTQREWEKVMSTNPSTSFKHPGHPVENVSWHDAQEYCKKLSELPEEIAKGYYYELPTEYEWEYSCRGGTRSAYTFGSTLTHDMANFDEKINRTTPVGSYPCNAFGLYDMHGNVWEWCACLYDAQRYKKEVEAAEKALREKEASKSGK